jgi:hypothetical protein
MKKMKKTSAGVFTILTVVIGMWVWTGRPVSARQPAPAASMSGMCRQLHAELMSMLPQSVQQTVRAWHGSH